VEKSRNLFTRKTKLSIEGNSLTSSEIPNSTRICFIEDEMVAQIFEYFLSNIFGVDDPRCRKRDESKVANRCALDFKGSRKTSALEGLSHLFVDRMRTEYGWVGAKRFNGVGGVPNPADHVLCGSSSVYLLTGSPTFVGRHPSGWFSLYRTKLDGTSGADVKRGGRRIRLS
jgi:hypothetical protein